MPEPTMLQPIPSREQIGAIIELCVTGALDFLMGESNEDRRKAMHQQHDEMLKIIDAHPVPEIKPYVSPREMIMKETTESNEHVRTALEELEKAQSLAKCSVCKKEIGETIDIVSSKTQEILDASEKVLVMQRLKDVGELPPDIHWEELNKNQKRMVENLVERFRPEKPAEYFGEGGEEENGEIQIKRKNPRPRKSQKPKQKPRRK